MRVSSDPNLPQVLVSPQHNGVYYYVLAHEDIPCDAEVKACGGAGMEASRRASRKHLHSSDSQARVAAAPSATTAVPWTESGTKADLVCA